MAIVPRPLDERVLFFETHLAAFAEHAAQIGTTPEAVASLAARTQAARAALERQLAARSEARMATQAMKMAMAAMSAEGANVIAQVRTRAQTTGDRAIYGLALLSPPADPAPIGEPGTPSRLWATFDASGALTLRWTCRHPRGAEGTTYEVARSTAPRGVFQHLGVCGSKRYVDETIPAGATALTYRIRALRSTKVGKPITFNVNFGSNGAKPLPDMLRAA